MIIFLLLSETVPERIILDEIYTFGDSNICLEK